MSVERTELPPRRLLLTTAIHWQRGKWLCSVGFDRDGHAREIFVVDRVPIDGREQGQAAELAIRVSQSMQVGVPLVDLAEQMAVCAHPMAMLLRAALIKARQLEAEDGAMLRDAYACAEGKHPLQQERAP